MRVLTTVAEMAALEHASRRGAVFTMGALHAGHVELMRQCRKLIGPDGMLIVTVFVNPTQFGDPKDLENYPRTLEADSALCEAAGVDVLFAPTVQEMYPPGVPLPQFSAGWLGSVLEGRSRPGHFDAVASVVHRLLSITQADVTCFGEKDYQQLVVVRQMVHEAGLNVEVVGVPTVRDDDGLALSSRNIRLSAAARSAAVVIPRALMAVAESAAATGNADEACAAGNAILARQPLLRIDYLVITDVELGPAPATGAARALVAATLDGVRLIDNVPVTIGARL